jgi:hypothetical protein
MKTILLALFFTVFLFSAQAQDWCHSGAQWHYSFSFFGQLNYYIEYKLTGDTVVQGKPCHVIGAVKYSGRRANPVIDSLPDLYTYATTDTIFFYFPALHDWRPLCSFAMQVGDTFTIPNTQKYPSGTDTFIHARVDSVGTFMVDTHHLRFYTFHLVQNSCTYLAPSYSIARERLGMQIDMMPYWHCVTDDDYGGLCSYQDDSFNLYKPYPDCDLLPTGIEELAASVWQVSPLPAHSYIHLQTPQSDVDATVTLTDISGREVRRYALFEKEVNIPISHLDQGLYLLHISEPGHMPLTQKVLIENR